MNFLGNQHQAWPGLTLNQLIRVQQSRKGAHGVKATYGTLRDLGIITSKKKKRFFWEYLLGSYHGKMTSCMS